MSDPYEPSRDTERQHAGHRKNDKVPALPKWTPSHGDEPQVFADYLNEVWPELDPDPIVGAERFGTHGDAAIALIRLSGARIRWPHQVALQKVSGLQGVMTQEAGIRPRKLTALDAVTIGWAIVCLSRLRADLDHHEEFIAWWERYIDARKTKEGDPENLEAWRVLLAEWQAARAYDEHRKPDDPRHTFIIVDVRDGVRYVSRNDFAAHVRSVHKGALSWPTINSRAAEEGWQQTRFQMRPSYAGAPYVEARCYVVPADWPDPDPGDSQQELL